MMAVEYKVDFRAGRHGRREVRLAEPQRPQVAPAGRVPRVTRLMALAIRFERLVGDGDVDDYADIARLGQVTRARISQITALLNLAPDLQEAILDLPRIVDGRDPISERDLRPIAAVMSFRKQRRLWLAILAAAHMARETV